MIYILQYPSKSQIFAKEDAGIEQEEEILIMSDRFRRRRV
jgi:hypothetical protein